MRSQKLVSAGFAIVALASASIPALAYTVWPDVDFEWYTYVGQPLATPTTVITLAPRNGYIVSPGHWETRGTRQVYVATHYVKDDYPHQLAVSNNPNGTPTYPPAPLILRYPHVNLIP